jgi:hypothetical protein
MAMEVQNSTNAHPGCCFTDSLASRSRPTGKVDEICNTTGLNGRYFISYFS